jgi:UPF0271 protein
MRAVLDSTVFFTDIPLSGDLYVSPSVISELRDIRAKSRLDTLLLAGLHVCEPGGQALKNAEDAARRTGDLPVLSATDLDILALALEEECGIMTDDFAVQNVAIELGIPVIPVQQRSAKRIKWRFRCSGCGRYYDKEGECPVCGSPVKRKLK